MSIEDTFQQLSENQRTRIDERDRQREKNYKKMVKGQRRAVGLRLLGGLAGDFFSKKAASQTSAFLNAEPIMAQRVKYNQGVKNSIRAIEEHEKAMNHATGMEDYYTDLYTPEVRSALERSIRKEDYTQQGYETFIDNKAREYAKTMVPLHEKAYQAALRVDKNPEAFDNFIKVNDGIPDTRVGATMKGIVNMFRKQSPDALASRVNSITNSRYVLTAESMNTAMQAVSNARGQLDEGDATRIAESLEEYKATSDDWQDTGRSEPSVQNIKIAGVDHTIRGNKVVYRNSWGEEQTRFVPLEDDKDVWNNRGTVSSVASETAEINGIEKQRSITTVYDQKTNAKIDTPGPWKVIGMGKSDVSKPDAEAAFYGLYQNLPNFTSPILVGSDDEITGRDLENYMLLGTDLDPSSQNYERPDEIRVAFGQSIVTDAGKIQVSLAKNGMNMPDEMAMRISQEQVRIDVARYDAGYLYGENSEDVLRRSNRYNPILTVEAIASLGNIPNQAEVVSTIVNSQDFADNLMAIKNTPEAATLLRTFNMYKDEENYDILFQPIIRLSNGQGVSVMDALERAVKEY